MRIFVCMKRFALVILLCVGSIAMSFGMEVYTPKAITKNCQNMSQQQIFDLLSTIMADTLGAEIASRDSTLLLAYIEKRPENCVAVIYTVKFLIEPGSFNYTVYYGVTSKDNTEECQHDVLAEMKEIERLLRQVLRNV